MKVENKEHLEIGRLSLAQGEWIDWILAHGKMMSYGLGSLLLLLTFAFYMMSKSSGNARSDYAIASKVYANWERVADGEESSIKQLEMPLKRHPELEGRFGTLLAQRFLGLNQAAAAAPYAKAVQKRTKGEIPYYQQFAETTLLIGQAGYLQALIDAKKLKEAMDKDTPFWENQNKTVKFGSLLYAFNLLRIAMLEKETGSPEGEFLAWQELKKSGLLSNELLASKTYDPEAYHLLQQNFQTQGVSLIDYIEHREKILQATLRKTGT